MFGNLHERFFDGVGEAGLWKFFEEVAGANMLLPMSTVWERVLHWILADPGLGREELERIKGGIPPALERVKEGKDLLADLAGIITKRKIITVHFWNFRKTQQLAERYHVQRRFDAFMESLKNGGLDWRDWLFERRVRDILYRVARNVERRAKPPDSSIDLYCPLLSEIWDQVEGGQSPGLWWELHDAVEHRRRERLASLGRREEEHVRPERALDILSSQLWGIYEEEQQRYREEADQFVALFEDRELAKPSQESSEFPDIAEDMF